MSYGILSFSDLDKINAELLRGALRRIHHRELKAVGLAK